MTINIEPYVSICPRVYHVNVRQKITIRSKFDFIRLQGNYSISILPRYEYDYNGETGTAHYNSLEICANDNELTFYYEFGSEQEYYLYAAPIGTQGGRIQGIKTSVYALKDDLYMKKVMKGDLHLHTAFSDGLESPEHRAIVARNEGFDFISITDHNNYFGSTHLIEKMKKCRTNMVFIRGEEVHAPKCPVHILSLGAKHAIAPLVENLSENQRNALSNIVERYSHKLKLNVDKRAFAAAMDVFDKIHEADGVSVLCHIYWNAIDITNQNRMGAPEQLIDALVDECKFDAFEITSGAPAEDLQANYLQESYYREKLPPNFPIIGITDSHTTLKDMTIFGKNYTIAFVDERSEAGVLDAIKQGLTVSVDGVGTNILCHGSLRLVKYATFLRDRFFECHDEFARMEAAMMRKVLEGKLDYINLVNSVSEDNNLMLKAEWESIV